MNLRSIRLKMGQPYVLFSLGILIIVFLFCLALYFPQKERVAELKAAAENERHALSKIENFLNQHADLGAYEREIDGRLSFVNGKLPDEINLGAFIAEVEKAAAESGVTLLQVKPGQGDALENYRRTPLFIELKGEYVQILNFLKKLEAFSRFHTVYKMELQKTKDALQAKLLLIIYAFGTPQEVNKEEN